MTVNLQDMLNRAAIIRDAYMPEENTALRVGSLLVDIVSSLSSLKATSLTKDDIPTVDINTVEGLKNALGDKLDSSIFDAMFEKVILGDDWYIHALKGIVAEQNVTAFGIDGSSEGGSGSSGASFGRLDRWEDYDATRATDALSAGLGYDLYTRHSSLEAMVDGMNVQLNQTATMTWVREQGYATEQWVREQGFTADGGAAKTADRLAASRKIFGIDFDGSSDVNGDATVTGTLSARVVEAVSAMFEKTVYLQDPASARGIYFEVGTEGDLRINCMLDNEFEKILAVFHHDSKQLDITGLYVIDHLSIAPDANIFGSMAIAAGECLYLNHERTAWVRFDASRQVIETSHTIVSQGNIIAFDEP